MTQNNQVMFASLGIPKGHLTCIIPSEGKHALRAFSRVYGSNIEVEDSHGTIVEVTTPEKLIRMTRLVHGEPLIVHYAKGGLAFLDFNDDSLVLILPHESSDALRSSIDVKRAYAAAIDERQIWAKAYATRAAIQKFDELLKFAIQE